MIYNDSDRQIVKDHMDRKARQHAQFAFDSLQEMKTDTPVDVSTAVFIAAYNAAYAYASQVTTDEAHQIKWLVSRSIKAANKALSAAMNTNSD